MKKIYCMLLTVLLLLSLSTVVFADEKKEVMEESGMTLTYTDEFDENNLNGIFESDSYGKVEHGVYPVSFVYYAMSREEFDAIVQKEMDEITEADLALLRSKMGSLATVYGVDRTQLSDRMAALLEEAMGNMTELASVGNLVFYSYYDAESDNTEEYLAGIAPAYQEEFKVLKAAIQDVLKNGEYYVPVIPGEDMVGKVFSFEGTDLDGNPIKSEDIFKNYDVIMVNLWATWCHNCVNEMTALGEMAERLAEKNVAVVGICMDADDELDACKEILKEHNVNYLNLMPVKNLDETLDWNGALPTSYFFGSDGSLLSPPFRGAPQTMEPYEEIISGLLEGKTVVMERPATPYIAANSEGVYRVIVSDSDGNLVKGATVQFCSDTACMFGKTDENGVVVFAAEEGPIYNVHILKVPEGYVKSTEEYLTGETYCDICIPLDKVE